jgi:hypothetical protein
MARGGDGGMGVNWRLSLTFCGQNAKFCNVKLGGEYIHKRNVQFRGKKESRIKSTEANDSVRKG